MKWLNAVQRDVLNVEKEKNLVNIQKNKNANIVVAEKTHLKHRRRNW